MSSFEDIPKIRGLSGVKMEVAKGGKSETKGFERPRTEESASTVLEESCEV